jgi:hypothetical protein
MHNNYIPKPWHLFVPLSMWTIATLASLRPGWETLGAALYGLGLVATFVIAWASIWDVFVRKADALRNLYDSIRGLDDETIDRILYAMGLRIKERLVTTNITITNQPDATTSQTRYIRNLPASPEQIAKLAAGLITEHAPVSRREWVERRRVFSDHQWRQLTARLETEKLIGLRDASKPQAGYCLTDEGTALFTRYAPSPTPAQEVPIN